MIRRAVSISVLCALPLFGVSCSEDFSTDSRDTVKPTVYFTESSTSGRLTDGITRSGIVHVAVDANDNVGITRVDLYAGNRLVETDPAEPYEFEWDMESYADGSQTALFARAVDVGGNTADSATITVTKGVTAAPTATITGPVVGPPVMQGDPITFSGTASDSEDGALGDESVSWYSDLQGLLGKGLSLTHRGMVIGTHTVTMLVHDSNAMITETPVTVQVTVTENDKNYGVIEAGTYAIGQPVYPKRIVVFTRPLMVSKTETTVQEFVTRLIKAYELSGKVIFDCEKELGARSVEISVLFPKLFYTTITKVVSRKEYPDFTKPLLYPDYPVSFIYYIEACAACNARSTTEGLTPVYTFMKRGVANYPEHDSTFVARPDFVTLDLTANGWRMPTESEYEVFARSGYTGMKYPWGNQEPASRANSKSDLNPPPEMLQYFIDGRGVTPALSYQPNRYGLYNVVGNVAEMTSEPWASSFPTGGESDPDPISIHPDATNAWYVVKGGTWYNFGNALQIGLRTRIPYSNSLKNGFDSGTGLRMVRNFD